jgi:hypothetical protein
MRRVLLAAALSMLGLAAAHAAALPPVEVWKSPYCGCCGKWVDHLRAAGFEVAVHHVDDLPAARAATGMPQRYGACHSATVGGYAVEGHVPAADVKRLLAEGPAAVGIAVPAMPPGSPGMEGPRAIPYDTLLVGRDGAARVFARH